MVKRHQNCNCKWLNSLFDFCVIGITIAHYIMGKSKGIEWVVSHNILFWGMLPNIGWLHAYTEIITDRGMLWAKIKVNNNAVIIRSVFMSSWVRAYSKLGGHRMTRLDFIFWGTWVQLKPYVTQSWFVNFCDYF